MVPQAPRLLSRHEVVAALKGWKRISDPSVEVGTPGSIDCIPYRDLIEAFLSICGVRDGKWASSHGGKVRFRSILRNVVHLFEDLVSWPFVYSRISRLCRSLAASTTTVVGASSTTVCYLRTDHWFNLKSGGSVGHTAGVIAAFRQLGHRVQVLSSDHLTGVTEDKDFVLLPPALNGGENLPEFPEMLYSSTVVDWIEANRFRLDIGILYQRYSLGNLAGVMLRERYSTPFVCEYNGSFVWMARHWGSRPPFHERLIERIEMVNLTKADLIVVVSEASKAELQDRGIPADKILVNPNGVDLERFHPSLSGRATRESLGLGDSIVVGFIGTFGPWHGVEVLARAFHELLEKRQARDPSIKLLLIGDGARRAEVEDYLMASGIRHCAVLTGQIHQSEAADHLAACDILVSPHVANPDGTPFFGSPTKLFEYMAMGKAIVASRLDQIGNVIHHERNGLLARPGDSQDVCQALQRLVDDVALRVSLGTQARKDAEAHYSWKAHVARILSALRERRLLLD